MSARIYTAYRLKKSEDLWPFVRDIRRQALPRIHEVLQQMFMGAVGAIREKGEVPEDKIKFEAERQISNGYRDQLSTSQRNEYDFDVHIAIREHEGRLYLIPHCDMFMRHVLDFLNDEPRLEDFAYWNNSDEPEGMDPDEWAARGAIWDLIDSGPTIPNQLWSGTWSDYVVIEIFSYQGYWLLKPNYKLL